MLRTALAAIASALALTVPLAVATPAVSADKPHRATAHDQTEDVWRYDPETKDYVLVTGGYPAADVHRAMINHGASKITASMKFLDLKKKNTQYFAVKIKTPELTRVALVRAGPGSYAGRHRLETNGGKEVSDKGMTHRISYTKDVMRVSIPRTLLSDPEWIRGAMVNLLYTTVGDLELVDHPANDQAMTHDDFTTNPLLTDRLYPENAG